MAWESATKIVMTSTNHFCSDLQSERQGSQACFVLERVPRMVLAKDRTALKDYLLVQE